RRGGETDDDRGEHQRLRQRVGVLRDVAGHVVQHRIGAGAQAADGEDEVVHGIGDQGQPDDHLERARAQQQPHAGGGEDPDRGGEYQFHQPSPSAVAAGAWRGRRSDWWASAINIRMVAPTTVANTPRSNSKAVASGTRPNSGSSRYWK